MMATWRTFLSGSAILRASVVLAAVSVAIAAAALYLSYSKGYSPITQLELTVDTSRPIRAGDSVPLRLSGCVRSSAKVPVVVFTLFTSPGQPEALLGPGAIALAEPGCRVTDTVTDVPDRAAPGEWQMALVTFAQGPLRAQTVILTSEVFTIHE